MYRAPMRSRRDDVHPQLTINRAQALGLCGSGGDRDPVRLARRIERFAEVARNRHQPNEEAKPLTSRMLAANTSGIALPSTRSPAWQVPATTRPIVGTPARRSLR